MNEKDKKEIEKIFREARNGKIKRTISADEIDDLLDNAILRNLIKLNRFKPFLSIFHFLTRFFPAFLNFRNHLISRPFIIL